MSQVQRLLILFCLVLSGSSLSAQDIHFTQFYMSPMTLNPAMAGKFKGTVRIGGIYRNQFSSVLGSGAYSTPSAWVDAPLFRGLRRQDWIGAGLMLFQDQAGAGNLKHSAFKLGASYHFSLDKDRKNVLTLGVHYGGEQRNISQDGLTFEDQFPSGSIDPSLATMETFFANGGESNVSYTDWDAGLLFTSQLNKTTDMNIGVSMYHLFQPNYSLTNTQNDLGDIPRRMVVHGQFNTELSEKFTLSPRFLFQSMSGADEIVVQGMGGYLFNQEKQITINFGLGYRLGDAVQALAGAKIKDLTVGLAYDINVSDLSTITNYRGGFELAANYIIRIYKPPVVVPKALCPRY